MINILVFSGTNGFALVNGYFKDCILMNFDQNIVIPEVVVQEAGMTIDCDEYTSDGLAILTPTKIMKHEVNKALFICQSQ